jgi:hypothetical protein
VTAESALGGDPARADTRIVALDDPELQTAMARYAQRDRPGPVHIVFTMLLLAAHLVVFVVSLYAIALSAMWFDNCAYVACGDDQWINRAMEVMLVAGGSLLVLDVVATSWLLIKSRKALWVPMSGCLAQLALTVLAGVMVHLAGPL